MIFRGALGQFEGAQFRKLGLWVWGWFRKQWEDLVVKIFEKGREGLALLCRELAGITEGEGTGVAEGC